MPMTNEEFEALATRLEAKARANPALYRVRVASFAVLGYAYLAAMIALLFALLGFGILALAKLGAVALKFLLFYVPFVWLVLRAMWVEVHPPNGYRVTRRDAPLLLERIERLRKALGAPRFHQVVINDEFNAAVSQVPMLGVFGWHRNYLVIGLPLMKALTPAQLDAVVAHELGHLAGGHARFGNRLYRLRRAWSQLLDELHRTKSGGAFLFRGFFDWYVPRFEAWSFPLARENEYAADAASARIASPAAAAQALTAVNVVGSWLAERYWPRIHARADLEPYPSFGPYSDLGVGLDVEIGAHDSKRWLNDALARTTGFDNTHPCLADRLRALGEPAAFAPPAPGESADRLLGGVRDAIVAKLDRRWQDQIIHDWRKRYDEAQASRERLEWLVSAASSRELDAHEAVERARLERSVGAGIDVAIAQLRAISARHPDDAAAHYFLGAYLLERDDDAGIGEIERAMRLQPDAGATCCATLRDHFARRGHRAEAEQWHRRMVEAADHAEAMREERGRLRTADTLLPHGLDAAIVAKLGDELAALGVRGAWLARKKVELEPERPLYVLAFSIVARFGVHEEPRARDVQRRILETVALPGETLVFCADGPHAPLGRRVAADGAAILGAS